MANWNEDADIGLTYKGYFQIYDGATPYRYKSLQEVTVVTAADAEKYFDDAGLKRKKSLGDSSTFQLRTKLSADLWATGNPPYTGADARTISAFQTDIISNRIIPTADFEGVQETEAASNEFVHVRFTAFVEDIEITRNPSTGVPEVVISGEIETLTTSNRQAT